MFWTTVGGVSIPPEFCPLAGIPAGLGLHRATTWHGKSSPSPRVTFVKDVKVHKFLLLGLSGPLPAMLSPFPTFLPCQPVYQKTQPPT